jgi:Chloramphenicol phosphotransferase-like protein
VAARLFRRMRHAIAAMAAQGNDLIVDDVLTGPEKAEYAEALAPFAVFLVGVFALRDVLEAWEAGRGDRLIGLARWQFGRVHQGMTYDLELDTGRAEGSRPSGGSGIWLAARPELRDRAGGRLRPGAGPRPGDVARSQDQKARSSAPL